MKTEEKNNGKPPPLLICLESPCWSRLDGTLYTHTRLPIPGLTSSIVPSLYTDVTERDKTRRSCPYLNVKFHLTRQFKDKFKINTILACGIFPFEELTSSHGEEQVKRRIHVCLRTAPELRVFRGREGRITTALLSHSYRKSLLHSFYRS